MHYHGSRCVCAVHGSLSCFMTYVVCFFAWWLLRFFLCLFVCLFVCLFDLCCLVFAHLWYSPPLIVWLFPQVSAKFTRWEHLLNRTYPYRDVAFFDARGGGNPVFYLDDLGCEFYMKGNLRSEISGIMRSWVSWVVMRTDCHPGA